MTGGEPGLGEAVELLRPDPISAGCDLVAMVGPVRSVRRSVTLELPPPEWPYRRVAGDVWVAAVLSSAGEPAVGPSGWVRSLTLPGFPDPVEAVTGDLTIWHLEVGDSGVVGRVVMSARRPVLWVGMLRAYRRREVGG